MSRKCSICHGTGHNSRTCPKAQEKSPNISPDDKKSQDPQTATADDAPAPDFAAAEAFVDSEDAKTEDPGSGSDRNAILAEEIVKDLQNDDELAEAILDFQLPSTDDGKDSNYEPSAGSSSEGKNSIKAAYSPKAQPQFDKSAQTKTKNQSKKAPVRVYRDSPPSKSDGSSSSQQKTNGNVNPAPTVPRQQLPLNPGSYTQSHSFQPRFYPAYRPFNRFQRNPSNWRTPSFPRPQNSYPRPSLRFPLSNLQPNVPLQHRGYYTQPNHQHFPQATDMYMGQPPAMPPLTPNMPSPPTTSPPPQPPTAGHAPQNPPPATHGSPPTQPTQNSTTTQPTANDSASPQPAASSPHSQPAFHTPPAAAIATPAVSSALDPTTGIIRPSHDYVVQMHGLGLKVVYAVAWTGGGAVFLSLPEATISHNTASSAGSKPLSINTFANVSLNLFQNEALAINWILENKAKSTASPPSSGTTPPRLPPPSGMSAHPAYSPSTTPATSTRNQAQMSTPSPQAQHGAQPHLQQQTTPQPPTSSTPGSPSPHQSFSNSPTSLTTLLSADEWSFSQEDILVRKCLLDPNFAPITIETRTPNPNRLPYLAAPGSAKGIIISGPESSLQKMVIDPATGSISIRPRHLQTLRLLDFPTFLSLMFRAIDMTQRETSQAAKQAATAVRTLLRDLTRQYESLQWSSEPSAVWQFNAYLRWTHMVLTRVLLIGFNCEHAFLSEAKNRVNNSNHQSRFSNLSLSPNPGPLIHSPSKSSNSNTANRALNRTDTPTPAQKSSHWFICPCCGVPNDHFSPACPTQADGPKPIPKFLQDSTRASIEKAPITQQARSNLLRMATSLYAKLDKAL